ncbi:MAG: class I SAM-dependent methyltransferase [Planctomycetes bacterium]|nr:class I SAM-dependent methyltransferase [Planctomycetota bacterium]
MTDKTLAPRSRRLADLFATIMRRDDWTCAESISGTGSTLEQTAHLRAALPPLLTRLGIRTMLDLPCGDLNWIRHVELPVETYIGGDIVEAVVLANRERFPDRTFLHLDITADDLPAVDLILCRDCLVHFGYEDIRRALRRLRASGATYLLTTVFTGSTFNKDIPTGGWRQLNLLLPPFSLPKPLEIINEACTEADGKYADKSLALWRIRDL